MSILLLEMGIDKKEQTACRKRRGLNIKSAFKPLGKLLYLASCVVKTLEGLN
jgi:hypothetical protein